MIIFISLALQCVFQLVSIGMVKELTGGYVIKYHANGLDKEPIEIDFTPPFRSLPCFYVVSVITICLLI